MRVPRRRGREEIGLVEKDPRPSWDEVLLALAVGGLSQRKALGGVWRNFVGGTLRPATLGAVLQKAEGEIQPRRQQPLSPARYGALVVDGMYGRYRRQGKGAAPQKGVLRVAVEVENNPRFQVRDWLAAPSEDTEAYQQLFHRLFQRGLETGERIVSEGWESIPAAAPIVYPAAAHPLGLTQGFGNLPERVPPLDRRPRRKFRREFGWIGEADDERPRRLWAARFCRRGRFGAPLRVEKFPAELNRVLAYLRWPLEGRHRLRTRNLAEGFFRPRRRYLSRFPGCRDAAPSEHVLGCSVLAAEPMHA